LEIIHLREKTKGFYSGREYFVTKVIYDLFPLRLFPTFFMGTIAFFMIGITASEGGNLVEIYLKYQMTLLLFSAQMGVFCLVLATAIGNLGTATLVASISILFQMLFAGFLINGNTIPVDLRWIQYLSVFKYAYEAIGLLDAL
jgi:ABC-type multidrug transport system permease subunit